MTEDVGTLIARLREATGADRWLDAEIFRAIDAPLPEEFLAHKIALEWSDSEGCFVMPVGAMRIRYEQPAYTASIDAALTLVPAEFWLNIETAGETPGPNTRRYPVIRFGRSDTETSVQAATIPLALVIAALLARQAP